MSYLLLVLAASRPEQVIRDTFNLKLLRMLTARLALDDGYEANSDITVFLRSKFNEIQLNHPGGNLPNPWPSTEGLHKLVVKSSRPFIFASPTPRRLNIIFGIRLPEIATPFAELDVPYQQVFPSAVYIEKALAIFMVLISFKGLPLRPS